MFQPNVNMKKSQHVFMSLLVIAAIGAAVIFTPIGCTQPDDARRVLESAGYKNVEITGWRPMMAADDEQYSTGFSAIGPSGQRVTGAVTARAFGGSTIRID